MEMMVGQGKRGLGKKKMLGGRGGTIGRLVPEKFVASRPKQEEEKEEEDGEDERERRE